MSEYLSVLGLAALPFLGNFGGGLIAEMVRVSDRALSLALHAAAGIVLAVVGIELMPRAIEGNPPWIILLAFIAGGLFSIGADKVIDRLQSGAEDDKGSGPWMIYFAVAIDLFSDGVMIGTGSTISPDLGFLLALGQLSADIPEGFATIATFRAKGTTRKFRLFVSAAFALPLILGATIGYWLVRGQPEVVKLALLSFTAAILVKAAVEEMITHAHGKSKDTSLQDLSFIGGFTLFAAVSAYLG